MSEASFLWENILFVLIAVIATVFVLGPIRGGAKPADRRSEERARCLAQKEDVIFTIRDLDFDLQTEKVSPEDHAVSRERAEARGVEILQRLDELSAPPSSEELEEEILAMRRSIERESGRG